jgi:hypothetical protein
MMIAVGRIFAENALEATVKNACAVTVVWTWFEVDGMSSYRLLSWVKFVWGERWGVLVDRHLPVSSIVYASPSGGRVCA